MTVVGADIKSWFFDGPENPVAVGIQCHNSDTWVIKDCDFTITNGVGISVRGGNVTIQSCTFTHIQTESSPIIGKIQATDPSDGDYSRIVSGNDIAVIYKDGSYGCSNVDGEVTLTVNGTSYEYNHDQIVNYINITN